MIENHVFHDHPEIFLQINGSTLFSFPNETIELKEGEILIVPSELPHAEKITDGLKPFESVVITPSLDFLQCHISRESNLGMQTLIYYETIETKDKLKIRQFTDFIIEEKETDNQQVICGLLMALLGSVNSLLSISDTLTKDNSKITEVKNTILSNYHDSSLSVGRLANQLDCSADYLSWLFHKESGMTLNKYINRLRLKKAADLLKNTDYTISEIAWICGYKNPAYFSRVFSKTYLLAPRNFRDS